MITTMSIKVNAARPNMPLSPWFSFAGSPTSIRILDIPKQISYWNITSVKVIAKYPDNRNVEREAIRNGCVWVVTIEGCDISGKVTSGYEIVADGLDEQGQEVRGYVLGCGDIYIMDRDVSIQKNIEKYNVRYCDELPTNQVKGDVIYHNGNVRLFNGSEWLSLGLEPQVIEGIDNRINEVESSIPTKTSELENDSGFITVEDVPDNTKLFNDTKTKYIDGNGNIYEYFSEPTLKWVFSDGWNRELKVYSTTATADGTEKFQYYFEGCAPYSMDANAKIYSNESWKTDEERDALTNLTFSEVGGLMFPGVSATKVTMNGWSNVGVLANRNDLPRSLSQLINDKQYTTISDLTWNNISGVPPSLTSVPTFSQIDSNGNIPITM